MESILVRDFLDRVFTIERRKRLSKKNREIYSLTYVRRKKRERQRFSSSIQGCKHILDLGKKLEEIFYTSLSVRARV